jgi:signal transduction histidine kinase
MFNSLSGRFLILTILLVIAAEVLIFAPAVARFRQDYLLARLDRAQIASLTLLGNDMVPPDVEKELLENAGVFNVVLRRDEMRQLVLSSPIPQPVAETYDLRDPPPFSLIRDAMECLLRRQNEIIRIIGNPTRDAGLLIEVTMESAPLRQAMLEYGLRILLLSAVVSAVTAALLFLAVRRLLVAPIKGVVEHMQSYAAAPEDARRIIEPRAGVRELREAEEALQSMQTQLTGALRQKDHLAQLGAAVAKISHDLRNILTTAQLFADRLERSDDPAVARAAPKLVNSISRAVSLCEATLVFGRAEEPPPRLAHVPLGPLVDDLIEGERLSTEGNAIRLNSDIPAGMTIRCDPDQLLRVLGNLVRNARQAIAASGEPGEVTVRASEDDSSWQIEVSDTGPGLPKRAQEFLFTPFQGGSRKGGIGLGLAIAAELLRGHGGRLDLLRTGPDGTVFGLRLPKGGMLIESAKIEK